MGGLEAAIRGLGDVCLATLGRKILTWHAGTRRHPHAERSSEEGPSSNLFDPWQQRAVWPARTFHAAAQVALAGEEAMGVMEPDGHFVLLELPSGRTIADLKLDADDLGEIFLVHSGEQYLLLTQSNVQQAGFNASMNPFKLPAANFALGNTTSHFVPKGRLYAIDEQGKLMWPAPVKIRNRWLPLGSAGAGAGAHLRPPAVRAAAAGPVVAEDVRPLHR